MARQSPNARRTELKKARAAEEAALKTTPDDRCPYGGFRNAPARGTGFFRVEQIDGRWWFVCPDGHLFYSTGLNGVGAGAGTRVQGREDLFAAFPPANLASAGRGGRSFGGSFYTWNLARRFGDDWRSKWAELTAQRMAAWGFNTVHNWGAPNRSQPEPRVPYALMMRGWQTGRSIMGLPDVYAEGFARRREFVLAAFRLYLDAINAAVRKHDTNHLNLGIRFGGNPHHDVVKAARGALALWTPTGHKYHNTID